MINTFRISLLLTVGVIFILLKRYNSPSDDDSHSIRKRRHVYASHANSVKVDHRALVLSTDYGGHELPAYLLDAYEYPYDLVIIPREGFEGLLHLEESSFHGLYNVIIICSDDLQYMDSSSPSPQLVSALNQEQWFHLDDYEAKYRVRRINLNHFPSPDHGTDSANPNEPICCRDEEEQFLTLAPAAVEVQSGVRPTSYISTIGLEHFPARIVRPDIATPFFFFFPKKPYTYSRTVAAVVTHLPGDRQHLYMYVESSLANFNSLLMGHVWLLWGTHGLFPGLRRVFWNVHIDRIFRSSIIPSSNGTYQYRVTPQDISKFEKWQTKFQGRLNEESTFFTELGVVGKGILEVAKYKDFTIQSPPFNNDELYVKPAGTGSNQWPEDPNLKWNVTSLRGDSLFTFLAGNIALLSKFNWVSDTFSEENLNGATHYDVEREVATNLKMMNYLGIPESRWSMSCLRTGNSSGMLNPDALDAFDQLGVKCLIADKHHPLLKNTGPFVPFLIDKGSHQLLTDIVVLSRHPDFALFANASTLDEVEVNYRNLNLESDRFIMLEHLMAKEADRALFRLFSLDPRPFAFDQAAIRTTGVAKRSAFSIHQKYSIVSMWAEYVNQHYRSKVDWPVASLSSEQLTKEYLERLERGGCGIESKSIITDGFLITVEIKSKGQCQALMTFPEGSIEYDKDEEEKIQNKFPSRKFKMIQVGNDPVTMKVQMKEHDRVLIDLDQPVDMR